MTQRLVAIFLTFFAAGLAAGQEPDDAIVPPPEVIVLPGRCWIAGEYLFWWTRNDRTPIPLITTGSPTDVRPGAVDMPGTSTVFNQLDYRHQSGGRFTVGAWIDDDDALGVEAAGFMLESHTIHGKADSDRGGGPLIARPFVNAMTGLPDAQVITSPGLAFGGIDVFADSRFWGGELNVLGNLSRAPRRSVDLIVGLRYLGMKDELRFSQSSTLLAPSFMGFNGTPIPPPDIVSIRDMFDTNNHFYGGQVGLRGLVERGRWSLHSAAKIGLGGTRQELNITGYTVDTNSTGAARVTPGGLFSQPSNLSSYVRSRVTFISEVDLALNCRLTRRLSVSFGYTFLYWSDVARPGQQLNPVIDPRQVPSNLAFGVPAVPAQPIPLFESTDFWAQGLTCGLELKF